ncbi:MAG: type IX secretion system membrane protein PorP/SprF [Elusimicrobiota bacterium]|nr:type IX secretion system membrane protein PorP/SprF [Elusimicrobiota bacterium]
MFVLFCFLYLFCFSYSYSFLLTYHNVTSKNSSFVASVATNNDVNTIWSNPSNIEHIETIQLSFTHGLPFIGLKGSEYLEQVDNTNYEPGITENIFSAGIPLKKYGYTGIGVYRISLGNFYSDNLVFITYGRNVNKKFLSGAALKIFYREYGKDRYTEHYEVFRKKGYSKTAYTIDIAGTYKLLEHMNFAMVLHNITQPNLSLTDIKEDNYPLTARIGFGINTEKYKFGIELDYDLLSETSQQTKFFTSVEYNLFGRLDLSSSLGIGSNNYYDVAFGTRLNVVRNLSISYAVKYPLSGLKNVSTHKVGIDFIFYPKKEVEVHIQQEIKQQEVQQQKDTVTLQKQEQKTKVRIRSSVIKKIKKFFKKNEQK